MLNFMLDAFARHFREFCLRDFFIFTIDRLAEYIYTIMSMESRWCRHCSGHVAIGLHVPFWHINHWLVHCDIITCMSLVAVWTCTNMTGEQGAMGIIPVVGAWSHTLVWEFLSDVWFFTLPLVAFCSMYKINSIYFLTQLIYVKMFVQDVISGLSTCFGLIIPHQVMFWNGNLPTSCPLIGWHWWFLYILAK